MKKAAKRQAAVRPQKREEFWAIADGDEEVCYFEADGGNGHQ